MFLTKGGAWLPQKLVIHSGEYTGGEAPPTGKEVQSGEAGLQQEASEGWGCDFFSGTASHRGLCSSAPYSEARGEGGCGWVSPCSQAEWVDTSPSLRESGEWEAGSIVTMESKPGAGTAKEPQAPARCSLVIVTSASSACISLRCEKN